MSEERIVIVGAGEAGTAAAAALRAGAFDGEIVLLSEEQQLPYERPPLSKEVLLGVQRDIKAIRASDWYEENAIDLRLGTRVTGIDGPARSLELLLANGAHDRLVYDKLLLTTGARVRELPGHHPGIYYLRTQEDGQRLRASLTESRHVAIVGGGVIGLEVASSARTLGCEVTVVDIAPRLMARALAAEVSEFLHALHEKAGVQVLTGVGSLEIESHASGQRLHLGAGQVIDADIIVAGIGVVPNIELGRLAGCRIDNGIVVDGNGRTSVEDIYAAGDVASFLHPTFDRSMRIEAWQHAGRHGAHVAQAILGITHDYCEIPWFWTDQHSVNVQVTGIAADCDATHWRGDGDSRTAFHFAGGRLVGATTINNGRDIRPATKLLAAGWYGDPAELLDASRPFGKLVTRLLAETVD